MFPYGLQPTISSLANQELLPKFPPLSFGIISVMVHYQHIWPHWTVTHKLQLSQILKVWLPGLFIETRMSFDMTLPYIPGSST